jgi:enoyl-CoA hydratase/carnithine racemase
MNEQSGVKEQVLRRHDADGVARLTLNRPTARNALSMALMQALLDELAAIERDPTIKVVVIAGAGAAFCAGHDLRELRASPDRASYQATFALCSRLMTGIVRLPKPVIARVHGIATAAGCQIVATCDLAVAADTARFATPGVNIGLFCSTPMVALSRAVGRKAAMEMLLTGELIDAQRAFALGLVTGSCRRTVWTPRSQRWPVRSSPRAR